MYNMYDDFDTMIQSDEFATEYENYLQMYDGMGGYEDEDEEEIR